MVVTGAQGITRYPFLGTGITVVGELRAMIGTLTHPKRQNTKIIS